MAPTWLDKEEYPFRSNFFTINGNRLHYIDEGKGDTILFVHGTPSWSFDFRNVIKALRSSYRCIAIDHVGFGLSDKPKLYDYSTQNHSQTLEKFVMEMDIQSCTLVMHDFGGPIGMHMASRQPDRIKAFVMLNSWLWSSEGDPDFENLKKVLKSPLLPFLYRNLNFSPRFILPASFGDQKLPKKIRKQFTSPFSNPGQRNGVLAFAKSLLNDQSWFEELWSKHHLLNKKPLLLIWGMKDPVIKPAHLEKFVSGFPDAIVKKIETAGHFPQEEQPQVVAQFIKSFAEGN